MIRRACLAGLTLAAGCATTPADPLADPRLAPLLRSDAPPLPWTLAVAPAHCYALQDLVGHAHPRAWGLTAQVYALRRVGDGGLGDTLLS